MYIQRKVDKELVIWKESTKRKPLLLRGARQVGKSSSVRELAKQFDFFLEINFDRKESHGARLIFERTSLPKQICEELSVIYEIPVEAGRTLLFIDEIQSCLPAISSLRYFYEDYPELHVIAAGSLLEFALQELPSFGVGRIRSLFMYPFSFNEYLQAMDLKMLAESLQNASPENPLSEAVHNKCCQQLMQFIFIGGMPEVVATYVQGGSLLECQQVLNDLMRTFDDDFVKYKERVPVSRLRDVFATVIQQTGTKFTYSQASTEANHGQIKESIKLLELAGLVYPVTHTSANGIPLAAETNPKFCKYLIFDTGIYQRFLKLDAGQILLGDSLFQVNKGALAELFVGLEMIKSAPFNNLEQLFYWQREKQGSLAEVDYVVQQDTNIIPVEVKSGTKGSMQSMFRFLSEKNYNQGIRCSMENFGMYQNIRIYPLYAASMITSNKNTTNV